MEQSLLRSLRAAGVAWLVCLVLFTGLFAILSFGTTSTGDSFQWNGWDYLFFCMSEGATFGTLLGAVAAAVVFLAKLFTSWSHEDLGRDAVFAIWPPGCHRSRMESEYGGVGKGEITMVMMLICAAVWASDAPYRPPQDAIWPIVAQSRVIVTGTLTVPVEEIRSRLVSGDHDYVELHVMADRAIKGSAPDKLVVRWYTKPVDSDPEAQQVIALDGKKALLFLVGADDDPKRGFYFAGYAPHALSIADEERVEQVSKEVSAQEQVLAQFSAMFPAAKDPLHKKVKKLIDNTTQRKRQMAAFRELEELGTEAVPAIVMLMDDRRNLAIPSITLENKSANAFERERYYGPQKVVDAMDAILNQITGCSFGFICNGGTELERQEIVNGWRIYLYHRTIETNGNAPSSGSLPLQIERSPR